VSESSTSFEGDGLGVAIANCYCYVFPPLHTDRELCTMNIIVEDMNSL